MKYDGTDDITIYRVGECYWQHMPEGVHFAYNRNTMMAMFFLENPTTLEVQAFKTGPIILAAQSALLDTQPRATMLGIGICVDGFWNIAPYTIHLASSDMRPSRPDGPCSTRIDILLADAQTGRLLAIRAAWMKPEFIAKIWLILDQQLQEHFDEAAYDAVVAAVNNQDPAIFFDNGQRETSVRVSGE